MQRADRLGELSDAQPSWLNGMPGMDVINKIFAVLDESAALLMPPAELRPIRRMQVFAQIHTLLINVREELLERVDLLRHGIAKPRGVPVINLKIMFPFVNRSPAIFR